MGGHGSIYEWIVDAWMDELWIHASVKSHSSPCPKPVDGSAAVLGVDS